MILLLSILGNDKNFSAFAHKNVLGLGVMVLTHFLECIRFVDSFKKRFAEQVRYFAYLHMEFVRSILLCNQVTNNVLDVVLCTNLRQEFTSLKRRISGQPNTYVCLVAVCQTFFLCYICVIYLFIDNRFLLYILSHFL